MRLILFGFLLLTLQARAHQIDEITLHLEADGPRVRGTLEADAAYMLPRFRGDADEAPQDLAWLRFQDEATWRLIRHEAESYVRACLKLRDDGREIPYKVGFPDFELSPPRFMERGEAEELPMIDVSIDAAFTGTELTIEWNEPFGVVLIVQTGGGAVPVISGYSEAVLRRASPEAGPVAAPPSFTRWIALGFTHILPKGLDHIFFILGIFLMLPKWRPLLGMSLVFTLTHSLTLGLAAAGWIRLPERPVEIAIAASIAWIGIENLRGRDRGRWKYLAVAVFGLVHGLGFARMLTDLLPPDQPGALLGALAGFNIGVELGQLTILAAAFALFGWWPEMRFRQVRLAGSTIIALGGLAWLVERAFDLNFIPSP